MANWFHVKLKLAGSGIEQSPILMHLDGRVPMIGETIGVTFEGRRVRAIVRLIFSPPSHGGDVVHTITVDEIA
jgi:hypothetical protein